MNPPPPQGSRDSSSQLKFDATALTIAGSDPSGGAGLQADLKTFQQLGVYGTSVVTLLTVQNTKGVTDVEVMSVDLVRRQLDAVLDDISPKAIKLGALGSANIVRAIAERLQQTVCPIVVDPVMVSKHGHSLATDDVVEAYREHLLPLAYLVTPNRFEAERLCESDPNATTAWAKHVQTLGAANVLIKIGEVSGQSRHILATSSREILIERPRLTASNTHGTGCVLSAAITAKLALCNGNDSDAEMLEDVVRFGIDATFQAIQANNRLGKGIHPAEVRAIRF